MATSRTGSKEIRSHRISMRRTVSFTKINNMEAKLELIKIHQGGDYDSDFDSDSDNEKKKIKRNDLATKSRPKISKAPRSDFAEQCSREQGIAQRFHFLGLDAYGRHKKLVNDYILYYQNSTSLLKRDSSRDKTDQNVIQENHRFLWNEDDDAESTWEKRLAKKYYDKLFKEYCIADMSRYKENKVGMRWRIEKEVIDGKGQFSCGNKKCLEMEGLRTWEVNFCYVEEEEKKNALVKLRLCPDCSCKLNYHHKKREVKRKRKITLQKDDLSAKKQKQSSSPDVVNTETSLSKDLSPNENIETIKEYENSEKEIWSKPVKLSEDKSRDEEFEEYLEELFL